MGLHLLQGVSVIWSDPRNGKAGDPSRAAENPLLKEGFLPTQLLNFAGGFARWRGCKRLTTNGKIRDTRFVEEMIVRSVEFKCLKFLVSRWHRLIALSVFLCW